MANKKLDTVSMDATDTGIASGAVYEKIERGKDRHGQQATASAEEKKQREAQLKTRGRKGCKLQRISVAFSPDNVQLIRVVSSVMGLTTTEFINNLLNDYREKHAEDIEAAEEIYNRLNNLNITKGK